MIAPLTPPLGLVARRPLIGPPSLEQLLAFRAALGVHGFLPGLRLTVNVRIREELPSPQELIGKRRKQELAGDAARHHCRLMQAAEWDAINLIVRGGFAARGARNVLGRDFPKPTATSAGDGTCTDHEGN